MYNGIWKGDKTAWSSAAYVSGYGMNSPFENFDSDWNHFFEL